MNVHIGLFCLTLTHFSAFVGIFNPLQAPLLAQPERVQLLARLRLRSDCFPAPGCCGSQSVSHVQPECERAAAGL